MFGTIDAWLLFKLTGEFVTDPGNASRTLLLRHRHRALGPRAARAVRRAASRRFPRSGRAAASSGARGRTSSTATTCRSPASPATSRRRCSGRRCLEPGLGKNTYGTGSFVLQNAGTSVPPAPDGLLSTIAWQIGRQTDVRARGGDLRHRRRRAVAARRARDHRRRGRDGGARRVAGLQRRRVLRAGADGPRLAALGPVRARDDRRASRAAPGARTSRARRSRRWPTRRSTRPRDGADRRRAAARAAGRRRRDGQPLADAVPGRRPRRAGDRCPRSPRRRRSARRCSRASARRCSRSTRCARSARSAARYEPRMGEDERATLLDGWHRALDRSRAWAT